MAARTTGAASIRHVGLVALEALLVALIVWVTTMALAGATQSGALIGAATAAGGPGALAVTTGADGGVAVTVPAGQAAAGAWVHIACKHGPSVVTAQWSRIDRDGQATTRLAPASRPATCVAEQGYFSANGKFRVIAATGFTVCG
jgi:hypothetical protein